MCNWKSAVVIRSGQVYHHWALNSHEDIIAHFGLRDNDGDLCRVEMLPPKNDDVPDYANIDGYTLHVDESVTPAWFDNDRTLAVADELREYLHGIVRNEDTAILVGGEYIITGGHHRKLLTGLVVGVSGSARIEYVSGSARIGRMSGSARIEYVYGSARIGRMSGSARIEYVYGSARIEYVYGSARIEYVSGSARIEYVYGSARIEYVYGSARIEYVSGSASIGSVYGSARIENNSREQKP